MNESKTSTESVVRPNCRSNPHKKPCCMHPEHSRGINTEWKERQVCCWCGVSTEWVVTFIPEHGPKAPERMQDKQYLAGKVSS